MQLRRCLLLVALASVCPAVAVADPPKAQPAKPDASPSKPTAKPQNASHAPTPSTPSAHGSHKPAPPKAAPPKPPTEPARRPAPAPPTDDAALGAETPELRALAMAERELFPAASPSSGNPWPHEQLPATGDELLPRVHASGLPPAPPPRSTGPAEGGRDLSWLQKLQMPDLPVRLEARVVRYLEFFKDDPRGRALLSTWMKRSGRYRAAIRRTLKRKGMPEDLVYLAMIESGFEPVARSPAGAVGLWQFMPETGKTYGLSVDRWADGRMNVTLSTEAAADYLADLHRRFGTWELAMAGYNMGYGGVVSVVRRYNTNDYWVLSRLEGSLPWETTLYVPKMMACAIVGNNLGIFGMQDLVFDPPLDGDEVMVPPATSLATVATAAGSSQKEIEALNPELRAGRTPPGAADYPMRVPAGKGPLVAQSMARLKREPEDRLRHVVRFGESLDQIAALYKVPVARIVAENGIASGEIVRGGTTLLVPKGGAQAGALPGGEIAAAKDKPVVVVPEDVFVYADRRRIFYRVLGGDTLPNIANQFKVTTDEIRRWNEIDPAGRLLDGMTLQLFVKEDVDLSKSVVLSEREVVPVSPGTDDFFRHVEERGRRRTVLTAKAGETVEQIGRKHNVPPGTMERINRRPRSDVLKEGETVVVYVAQPGAPPHAANGKHVATQWPALPPRTAPSAEAPPLP